MNVRLLAILAVVATATCIATPSIALAAPLTVAALAPARAALAAVDAGDRSAFVDAFAPDASIVDEISPFRFAGENAAGAWFDRLAAVNRDNGISDERSTVSPASAGSIEGRVGYAVVPVRIAYRQRGKAAIENGAWTFALEKVNGAWKIAGAAFAPSSAR